MAWYVENAQLSWPSRRAVPDDKLGIVGSYTPASGVNRFHSPALPHDPRRMNMCIGILASTVPSCQCHGHLLQWRLCMCVCMCFCLLLFSLFCFRHHVDNLPDNLKYRRLRGGAGARTSQASIVAHVMVPHSKGLQLRQHQVRRQVDISACRALSGWIVDSRKMVCKILVFMWPFGPPLNGISLVVCSGRLDGCMAHLSVHSHQHSYS